MTVQPTSLDAYNDTVEPRLRQEERIWRYMLRSGEAWCIADIADMMNIEKSSVSPRFKELRKGGWLLFVGDRPSKKTGRSGKHYRAVVPDGGEHP